MKNIKINKQQIITIVFIILCLVGYVYFPAKNDFQYKASFFIFLAVLPFLYNKYFLKEKSLLKQITVGDWKNNLIFSLIGVLGASIVVSLVFKFTNLWMHYLYVLPEKVKTDFVSFLGYEFGIIAFMFLVYELFFRGFVMKYFINLGYWSILVQFLFFCLMILMLGKLPYWYYIIYFIFVPFAGWIFYKTKSVVYSFLGQWIFVVLVDATFIAMVVNK